MCEIQECVSVLTLSQYIWLMSGEGGDGLGTALGTLLLFKNALSLIKASFPNNKAVQLPRGVICLLFFSCFQKCPGNSIPRAYSRGEKPSQGHMLPAPLPSADELTRTRDELTKELQKTLVRCSLVAKAIGAS